MTTAEEIRELREEVARLRERVAVLEARPFYPWVYPCYYPQWGEWTTGSDYDMSGGCLTTGGTDSQGGVV